MILSSFLAALRQTPDPRFRRVLFLGIGLSLGLLIAIYAACLWLIGTFAPDSVTLPIIGPVSGLDTILGLGSAILMLGLSVFLMMPVASAFTSLFLDDVAQAVEDRHFPALPDPRTQGYLDAAVETLSFFGLLIGVNIAALVLYAFAGPFVPVVFWSVNGFLLGREYFTLVAARRMPREEAKAMRSRHAITIWMAGTLMAAPLSVPILNLAIPVLGAATFTHLFHRLRAAERR